MACAVHVASMATLAMRSSVTTTSTRPDFSAATTASCFLGPPPNCNPHGYLGELIGGYADETTLEFFHFAALGVKQGRAELGHDTMFEE